MPATTTQVKETHTIIAGKLVAEDGQQLHSCKIVIRQLGHPSHLQYSTKADDNGEFLFRGLEQGVYGVIATCDGYLPAEAFDWKDDEVDGFHCLTGDNITIPMIKTGVITGRVTSQDQPAVGVAVT